ARNLLRSDDDPVQLSARLRSAPHVSEYLLREVDAQLSQAERAIMEGLALLAESDADQDALEATLAMGSLYRSLIDLQRRQMITARQLGATLCYTQHALVREFYQATLTRSRQRQLHHQAADYYEHAAHDSLRAALHAQQAQEITRCLGLLTPDVQRFLFAGEAHLVQQVLDSVTSSLIQQSTVLSPALQVGLQLALGEVAAFCGQRAEARRSFEAGLSLLTNDYDNPEQRHQVARACRGMGQLLESEQPQTALDWLRRGLSAIGDTDPLERARLSNRVGSIQQQLGAYAVAQTTLQAALNILPIDHARLRADLLVNLGAACGAMGAYQEGRKHLREALQIVHKLGNRWLESTILQNLGIIQDIMGDWASAQEHYHKALQIADELDEARRRSDILLALGILHTNRRQYAVAEAYLEQALALADSQDAQVDMVYIQASLADLYLRMGRVAEAIAVAQRAEDLAEELDERSQLPEIMCTQALVILAEGQQHLAMARAEQALALAHERENPESVGICLRVRAEISLAMGDTQGSRSDCAASTSLLADNPYEQARTRTVWGHALWLSGDHVGGAQLVAQAQAVFARLEEDREQGA
ncbi:MAG: tetratricopeptide repeat protein, partial [Oscillochloris sp.]|nr:tetratricopeptide repeat protein [Oscillochloris sp.]